MPARTLADAVMTDFDADTSLLDVEPSQAPVLVVDDTLAAQRIAGAMIVNDTGRPIVYARNGREALDVVARAHPCLILTDLQMPEMDGLQLAQTIRARYAHIPVILMTAYGSEDIAIQALNAGASGYVPKRSISTNLVQTIRPFLTVIEDRQQGRRVLTYQSEIRRSFELENDLSLIAPIVDLVRQELELFEIGDATTWLRVGVAIQESLANAIVHGNLECSSDIRQADERVFNTLVQQRRGGEPYSLRRVYVDLTVNHDEARIVIRDEGRGFDVASLDKPFDPEDLMRIGGRGMLLIRTFLDEVTHNEAGNQITLLKFKKSRIQATY